MTPFGGCARPSQDVEAGGDGGGDGGEAGQQEQDVGYPN